MLGCGPWRASLFLFFYSGEVDDSSGGGGWGGGGGWLAIVVVVVVVVDLWFGVWSSKHTHDRRPRIKKFRSANAEVGGCNGKGVSAVV